MNITFGDGWTASQIEINGEPRWQLLHPNGGVSMANLAETALIEEVAKLRAEVLRSTTAATYRAAIEEALNDE